LFVITTRLYYTDSYLTTFDAHVVDRSDDERRVYLDRTAFYPTSGGQPFDIGTVAGVRVIDVVDETDRIAHLLTEPLRDGADTVSCAIDWPRRFDHMQQHTGQHVLSAVVAEMFGHRTVSVHFGAKSRSGAQAGDGGMIASEHASTSPPTAEMHMSTRVPLHRIFTLLALVVSPHLGLRAQQADTSRLLRGMALGASLDRFTTDGSDGITTVSLRITGLNPGRVGADIAITTWLPAIQEHVLVLGLDLGPALNLSGRNATGLLKVGASLVAAGGSGGSGTAYGAYLGGGLIARIGPNLGVRIDVLKRSYVGFGEGAVSVWSFSFGLTSVGKRAG
jgi:hypothetical protein